MRACDERRKAVMMPERPMARPPKAPRPVRDLECGARAHAVCGRPSVTPRTGSDVMRQRLKSGRPTMEPKMPVITTGRPSGRGARPWLPDTPMAIGVVTDFGIMEIIVSAESPKSQPKATTETMAATLPARRPQVRGSQSSTFLALLEERHSEHHGRGPEQEVNDACALEVLLVGHAHDEQHDDDAHDGHDDRREERIELREELVEMLAER